MALESYNPERTGGERSRTSRREFMIEVSVPESVATGASPAGSASAEGQPISQVPQEQPNRPWHFEPEYDPNREDYVIKEEERYHVSYDPLTGKEVARVLKIEGRAEEDEVEDNKPVEWLENLKKPEDLTSPEWGWQLVNEIARLRTTMSYEKRYELRDTEGKLYLTQLYDYLQIHVNELCKKRNERDPWDPKKAYKAIQERQKDNLPVAEPGPGGGPPELQSGQLAPEEQSSQSQRITSLEQEGTRSREDDEYLRGLSAEQHKQVIAQLTAVAENLDTPAEALPEIQRRLLIYFREAKRKGLLQGADDILTSLYREHIQPGDTPANQAAQHLVQSLALARKNAEAFWKAHRSDSELEVLKGIWNAYLEGADVRLQIAIGRGKQPDYSKEGGEFRLDREAIGAEEVKETYWQPASWSGYYIVTAKTPEEFRIAAESFFHLIKKGSIGKSPEDVFKHLQNFKEQFGSVGLKQVEAQRTSKKPDKLTDEFMRDLRLEFEVKSLAFLADYSNETYNPKTYNQAMTTLALHEGPERMVRFIRSGEGSVGAFTYIFDKDPLMEIFNNPVGERGELDIIAQHYLQDQIKQKVIERGIGIIIKDYDPREEAINLANYERYKNQDPSSWPTDLRVSIDLGRIITDLRGGKTIDQLSEQDQKNYIAALSESRTIDNKRNNIEQVGLHMPNYVFKALYEGFNQGDAHKNNYDAFQGVDQSLLPQSLRDSVNLGRIQKEVDKLDRQSIDKLKQGIKIVGLSEADQVLWKAAYDEAEANFDVAFQMQGASGEKVRRGRGFLYIDRNPYIQAYRAIEVRSSRIAWLLDQLQKYKETNGKEGKKLDDFGKEIQKFYEALTSEERTRTPQGLYGIDRKNFSGEQQRAIQIGWMLSEIKEERRLDTFTPQETALYNGLSEQEKSIYVDHIPTYLAEKFVLCAVTLTKIQHADSKAKDRSDAVDKARADAIKELKANGFQAKLKNADNTPMTLKRPKVNSDGTLFRNPDGSTEVEEVEVDFQLATDPNNIYNRYTTHTYWGYQGENRHMLLAPHIFEAVRRIRDGQSRHEDEDMLAGMLLITDPTLNRVREFGRDEIANEITLLQAAVNESFLDRVQVNIDLFKAVLPPDGNRGKMRAGFNMEDWGGQMRFAMGIKEFLASQPARLARRLGAEGAIIPEFADAMGSLWGREGVGEACSTMADQIKRYSHQGVVSQFGITKFVDMQHYAQVDLYNAFVGSVQESQAGLRLHTEGLLMKPTNDNEILHKFLNKVISQTIKNDPAEQLEFMQQLRSTFGRLETVLKVMRVMYSDTRNAGGALDLRRVDIFLENGKFNPAINENFDIKMNTGTSRQLEWNFYNEFTEWLLSEWPGGGGDIYPEELVWNRYLKHRFSVYNGKGSKVGEKTFKLWFFEKAGL